MSLPYGVLVSSVLAKIRLELQDTSAAPRWSDSLLLQYVNECFRDLGSARCFRRTDIIVPTAGRAVYRYLCEPVDVYAVWYNGHEINASSPQELGRIYGDGWQNLTSEVLHYVADDTLRITGIPSNGGSAPTLTGTALLTESEGKGPGGSGYWSFDNSGTLVHFLPGDGQVSGADNANNLWVDYAYMPTDVLLTEKILRVYEHPVTQFTLWRCFARSDDKGEQQQASISLNEYVAKKKTLIQSAGPKFRAGYTPTFTPDANGWEPDAFAGRGSTRSVLNG